MKDQKSKVEAAKKEEERQKRFEKRMDANPYVTRAGND